MQDFLSQHLSMIIFRQSPLPLPSTNERVRDNLPAPIRSKDPKNRALGHKYAWYLLFPMQSPVVLLSFFVATCEPTGRKFQLELGRALGFKVQGLSVLAACVGLFQGLFGLGLPISLYDLSPGLLCSWNRAFALLGASREAGEGI